MTLSSEYASDREKEISEEDKQHLLNRLIELSDLEKQYVNFLMYAII